MKKKIIIFLSLHCLMRFRAPYSHETLRKTPCCWPSHTITLKHYMYIQSDAIYGVEGHELAWLQSDRYILSPVYLIFVIFI